MRDAPSFQEFREVLEIAGPVEWMGLRGSNSSRNPTSPSLVFRYVNESPWFDASIRSVLAAFDGKVDWTAEKSTRNWVIWPTEWKAAVETGIVTKPATTAPKDLESLRELWSRSTADLPDLLAHLEMHLTRARGDND